MSAHSMRPSSFLLVSLTLGLSVSPAVADTTVTFRKVLERNDPAPGIPGETVFANFFNLSINGSGDAAFSASLGANAGVDGSNDNAIWAEGPGGIRLVAREGDGTPNGGTLGGGLFPNGPSRVINADDGSVAFLWNLGSSSAAWSIGVNRPDGSTLWTIDSLSGSPATVFNFTNGQVMYFSPTGILGFDVAISGSGLGRVGGPPESLAVLIKEGDSAPNMVGLEVCGTSCGAANFPQGGGYMASFGVTPDGSYGLRATLVDFDQLFPPSPAPGENDVVYLRQAGGWTLVAREGVTPIAPTNDPLKFPPFDGSINDAGQFAAGSLARPDCWAIVHYGAGGTTTVVCGGEAVPGFPGRFFEQENGGVAAPIITPDGDVFFIADTFDDGSLAADSIWRWTDATGLELVVMNGDSPPSLPDHVFVDVASGSVHANGNGDVLFFPRVAGPGIQTSAAAAFLRTADGQIIPAAVPGQDIELDTGAIVTVAGVGSSQGNFGPHDGRARPLNDARQVVLSLNAPKPGVYVATVQVAPPCPADLTGDGVVDGADLGALLGDWGGAAGDLTGDGVVDGADLGALLGAWGLCP